MTERARWQTLLPVLIAVTNFALTAHAYTNNILYTHSSDLKTLQEIFQVGGPGFLGGAADATDLSDLFKPGAIPSPVPEPSTWVMMGLAFAGLAGAAAYRRKLGATAKPAV